MPRFVVWLIVAACALVAAGGFAPGTLAQGADGHAPAAADHGAPEAAAHGAEAEGGHGEEEHGGGMPQLDASTFPSQIVWLIVAFGTLYYLLQRRALPRVTEILEARQDRISGDLERAGKLREEAEAAERQYDELVAGARSRASAELRRIQEEAAERAAAREHEIDEDLAGRLREAGGRIGAARDQALGELRGVAVEVAQAAVGRLVGIEVPRQEVEQTLDRVRREAA